MPGPSCSKCPTRQHLPQSTELAQNPKCLAKRKANEVTGSVDYMYGLSFKIFRNALVSLHFFKPFQLFKSATYYREARRLLRQATQLRFAILARGQNYLAYTRHGTRREKYKQKRRPNLNSVPLARVLKKQTYKTMTFFTRVRCDEQDILEETEFETALGRFEHWVTNIAS